LYARETLELYAPLANRLGIWQMKWELEDLSFLLLDAEAYKSVAKMLEENREEREEFITKSIEVVKNELKAAGIDAEISGRSKHIYSIWSKMRAKSLDFTEMTDVRAIRVIVSDIKSCFVALDIIHRLWTPILDAFDDYISRPKANGYRSLHTIVIPEDGMPLEVQIRTEEMHNFSEYGVAAHWRYKEAGSSGYAAQRQYDEKLSWLRQVLSWKPDVVDKKDESEDVHQDWVKKIKEATLDDRIYVLTPQSRVIDLPKGATPIDFAYQVHTQVGHRCRGARVDGVMVSLNTPLKSGQTVEIITAKGIAAGPSRDWLTSGFAVNARTHSKIRAWFNAIEHEETIANGRSVVDKILQREGKTAASHEELASRLGFSRVDDFYLSVGREKIAPRTVEQALHSEPADRDESTQDIVLPRTSRASSVMRGAKSGVLVMGSDGMLTQMAKCCKPAPPDTIIGFISRGKGVSVHRPGCSNFIEMQKRFPDRVIQTSWGKLAGDTVYPVDIFVLANDRRSLLRDISDVFLREKLNVISVNTQSNKGQTRMNFVVEVFSTSSITRALGMLRELQGVEQVKRN
jgi:GTP pyrophosphokinase